MLILAGIVLNCALFGALFRPLEAPAKKKEEDAGGPEDVKPAFLHRIKELKETHRDEQWDSLDVLPSVPQSSVSLPEVSFSGKLGDCNTRGQPHLVLCIYVLLCT